MRLGTGADRQVEVYNRTKDLKQVVDYIISETHHGLDL
jgi:carboxylate-amine ligase